MKAKDFIIVMILLTSLVGLKPVSTSLLIPPSCSLLVEGGSKAIELHVRIYNPNDKGLYLLSPDFSNSDSVSYYFYRNEPLGKNPLVLKYFNNIHYSHSSGIKADFTKIEFIEISPRDTLDLRFILPNSYIKSKSEIIVHLKYSYDSTQFYSENIFDRQFYDLVGYE